MNQLNKRRFHIQYRETTKHYFEHQQSAYKQKSYQERGVTHYPKGVRWTPWVTGSSFFHVYDAVNAGVKFMSETARSSRYYQFQIIDQDGEVLECQNTRGE